MQYKQTGPEEGIALFEEKGNNIIQLICIDYAILKFTSLVSDNNTVGNKIITTEGQNEMKERNKFE